MMQEAKERGAWGREHASIVSVYARYLRGLPNAPKVGEDLLDEMFEGKLRGRRFVEDLLAESRQLAGQGPLTPPLFRPVVALLSRFTPESDQNRAARYLLEGRFDLPTLWKHYSDNNPLGTRL